MKHLALLLPCLVSPVLAVDYLLVSQQATNYIVRFNEATGASMGPFVAAGSGGLSSPRGMAIGPDGNLYVADAAANRVKRFSCLDGSFIGDFTAADLLNAVALKFIGGDLYVLGGSAQRQIRQYNGSSGEYVRTVVMWASNQIGSATDFQYISGSGDWLVIGNANRGARLSGSTGVFIDYFINPTGITDVMSTPRTLLIGPDGNYWVTNRASNRITRYDASTGAKLNDVAQVPLGTIHFGLYGMIIAGSELTVANSFTNEILRYTITNAAMGSVSAATVLVPASAGLSAPEHILKVFIEDAPIAQAGTDLSLPGGEPFSVNGSASSDPEGLSLTYAWTQLSGLPLLTNPPVATANVPLTAPFTTGSAVFQLVVTDPAGKTATDTVSVTITAPLDANNNGLPDRWEATQPPLTGSANDDDDGDGTSNYFEFQAGTNPTDPASFFKLVSYDLAPAQATLRFRSGSGRNYQLQHSTNLRTWPPVPGHETLPGTSGEIEITTPAQTGFYRIAVKQDY